MNVVINSTFPIKLNGSKSLVFKRHNLWFVKGPFFTHNNFPLIISKSEAGAEFYGEINRYQRARAEHSKNF